MRGGDGASFRASRAQTHDPPGLVHLLLHRRHPRRFALRLDATLRKASKGGWVLCVCLCLRVFHPRRFARAGGGWRGRRGPRAWVHKRVAGATRLRGRGCARRVVLFARAASAARQRPLVLSAPHLLGHLPEIRHHLAGRVRRRRRVMRMRAKRRRRAPAWHTSYSIGPFAGSLHGTCTLQWLGFAPRARGGRVSHASTGSSAIIRRQHRAAGRSVNSIMV